MHYAVVGALVDSKKLRVERLHQVLATFSDVDPDDEDAHLAKAVKACGKLALNGQALASIRRLARSFEFEVVFEVIIGVETGGEADYMYLKSLAGIAELPRLKELDLRGLVNSQGKPLDLAPLAGHPSLESVNLGAGPVKHLEALLEIDRLKKLVVPEEFSDPLLRKLIAKKVTVSRAP